jgi:hypothetical protein
MGYLIRSFFTCFSQSDVTDFTPIDNGQEKRLPGIYGRAEDFDHRFLARFALYVTYEAIAV